MFVHVSEMKVAELPEYSLHPCHYVINEPAADPLVHAWLLFRTGLHVEELHQGLDGDALHEHGPIDHSDGRGNKHVSVRHDVSVNKEDEGEGDSTPETSVHHDELIHSTKL